MKKMVLVLALLLFLVGIGSSEQILPISDVLTTDSDGAIVRIFGLDPSMTFSGNWDNPVHIMDGVAMIGKGV